MPAPYFNFICTSVTFHVNQLQELLLWNQLWLDLDSANRRLIDQEIEEIEEIVLWNQLWDDLDSANQLFNQ